MSDWRPDVLGRGFECRDLELGEDTRPDPEYRGEASPLVATLVRSLPEPLGVWDRLFGRGRDLENVDVLYVHGWSDYFFQHSVADFWVSRGARFYALDLRRYGRSLRPGQLFGYIENLDDYDEEIGLAIAEIRGEAIPGARGAARGRRLVLFGHSTGGLLVSLWASRNRGVAEALVLNSPWLQLQLGDALRKAIAPMVNLRARYSPHENALPQIDLGFYKRAQRLLNPEYEGVVNAEWRPEVSPPVRSGWLKAILDGHARVAAGIDVGAPCCVMLSDRSQFGLSWRDEMLHADTVIEVEGVARAALKISHSVTIERIDGALHDVFLSEHSVRIEAYARLDRWLKGWVAAGR